MSANKKTLISPHKTVLLLIIFVAFFLLMLFCPYFLTRENGISKVTMKQPYGKIFLCSRKFLTSQSKNMLACFVAILTYMLKDLSNISLKVLLDI